MTFDQLNRRFLLATRAAATAALLFSLGCAGAGTKSPTVAPAPAATASATLPDEVRWVAESAEYAAATWQAFALARQRVETFSKDLAPGSWAVALDCDETVISNIRHEIEMARAGTVYDPTTWRPWVARREASAIPGAREFLLRVQELGGKVVFVTNRGEEERADTAANIEALGLPYDLLLMRGKEGRKESRWDAVEAGTTGLPPTTIVLWVGDNIQDFPNLDQSLRKQPAAAFAPFGDRFIVLPNPMYGSWKD